MVSWNFNIDEWRDEPDDVVAQDADSMEPAPSAYLLRRITNLCRYRLAKKPFLEPTETITHCHVGPDPQMEFGLHRLEGVFEPSKLC